MEVTTMRVKFWGVRGSIACPGPSTLKYGGNTACVEVRLANNELVIIDCGTGIRQLGAGLMKEKKPVNATILLSHGHMDHVYGFPFFGPAYMKTNHFVVKGCAPEGHTLRSMIEKQMGDVYFPVEFDGLNAEVDFSECCITCEDICDTKITAHPTNHPGGGRGYRLTEHAKSMVYLTDNELRSEAKDAKPFDSFVEFCRGAHLLIHDTQYTPEEYETWTKGWGHSRYTDVAELAVKADVEILALFHHDPDHDDAFLEEMLEKTRNMVRRLGGNTECVLAREGETIPL
jgi:phosphoribosyl 1,2-cyclic phosphodiesterase